MDGYYVHTPSKRFSKKYAYVKPAPYPTANLIFREYDLAIDSLKRDSAFADVQPDSVNVNSLPDSVITYLIPDSVVNTVYTYFIPVPFPDTMQTGYASSFGVYSNSVPYPFYFVITDSIPRRDTVHVHYAIAYIPPRDTSVMMQPDRDSLLAQNFPTDSSIAEIPCDTILIQPAKKDSVVATYVPDTIHNVLLSLVNRAFPTPRLRKNYPGGIPGAYAQVGLIGGPESYGLPVAFGSFDAGFGFRYEWKVKKKTHLIFDAGYRFNKFKIDQNKPKIFPLTENVHHKEHLSISDLGGAICARRIINTADTAKVKWIDVGFYGDMTARSANTYTDVEYNLVTADKSHSNTRLTGLRFLDPFDYGVTARVGNDNFAVVATYRISGLIKNSFVNGNGADLPRFMIGIEIHTFCGDEEQ